MKFFSYVFLLAMGLAPVAYAVVIRDDVADAKYLVAENTFPALVDLPGEGHGVLIAKQWVVTAAHATQGYALTQVSINGKWREVSELVLHPDFQPPAAAELKLSGDAAPLMAILSKLHDIALIRLSAPVEDVTPVQLYRAGNEQGMLIELYGKGATGNGLFGQYAGSPHRGQLRRAVNRIINADGLWLSYRFNCGANALPLEGVIGDGDSGGPVVIQTDGIWKLAGISSWKSWKGDLKDFRPGVCDQEFYSSRISHYAKWIDSVIAKRAG